MTIDAGMDRTWGRRWQGILPVLLALALAGCSDEATASARVTVLPSRTASVLAERPDASGSEAPSAPAKSSLTFVMFGDSWAKGTDCGGCSPFPILLERAYAALTGLAVDFHDDTTTDGTAQALAASMTVDPGIRGDIELADIIVIAIGANDLAPAISSSAAGNCGGDDHLDCFRTVAGSLRTAYDTMLTEIGRLREGRPVAVRMVTTSNEFLTDRALIEDLGADFGATGGVTVTALNRDVQCDVAGAHRAMCVDIGAALNGPDLRTPNDVNRQDAMQQVADAIAACGLSELGL